MSAIRETIYSLEMKSFKDIDGNSLMDDKDYHKLLELVQVAYMYGYINATKRLAVWRDGKQVIGIMEQPLSEFIKEQEAYFGMKYKDSNELNNINNE
jgi:hypothetical protein